MRRRRVGAASLVVALVLLIALGRGRLRPWLARGDRVPAPAATSLLPAGRTGPCRVLRVVDGDTLHVELASSPTPDERVRLLRIDTPERGEAGYERATACLLELTAGGSVVLEWEGDHAERDAYGRLLAYVRAGDLLLNLELVRRGYSRFFTKYGEGRYAQRFRAAQDDARVAKRGLWTDAGFNVAASSRGR